MREVPSAPSFRISPIEDPPAAGFVAAMRNELAELYEGLDIDGPGMPTAGVLELGPPDGVFIVGSRGEAPVCCGGIKRLSDGACELKRMFVLPPARGEGVAGYLLSALEQHAIRLGYELARLDTGPRQSAARRLFENAGYRPVENYNENPMASFFGEKQLLETSGR